MKMTRRQFSLGAMLFLVLNSVFMMGCNVFSDLRDWIPIGKAAVQSILAVLTGNGVVITPAIQQIVSLVLAGFDALAAAITEYQSTTPPPVGALAKVQTALKDIVDNFTTFLQSLNVSGGLFGIITQLAGIVLSTIAAFVNRLPAPTGAKTTLIGTSFKLGGKDIAVTPHKRSTGAFRGDWNKVLDSSAQTGVTISKAEYL